MSNPNRRPRCLVASLLAAHLAAGIPVRVQAQPEHPRVDPRAIQLFRAADTQLAQGNFTQAVTLAERVLQFTDPIRHRDQRGTIVQLIITASFKAFERDRLDADLCYLDQILDAYATEVLEIYEDITARDRILATIEEYSDMVRSSVEEGCPSPDATQPEQESSSHQQDAPHPAPVAPAQANSPESNESARRPGTPVDTRRHARSNVIAGGTLIGMSGAFLGGVGLTLWQVEVASRANAELLDKLNTEGGAPTETERASADANYAKTRYRKLAIGLGVSAGLMMAVGVPLLALGLRQRKGLRLLPAVSSSHTGLAVLGRF